MRVNQAFRLELDPYRAARMALAQGVPTKSFRLCGVPQAMGR